jgi:hypothetical protein
LEVVLSFECEIPSLKLTVELLPNTTEDEQRLLYLSYLDEICRDAALANESHLKRIKQRYGRYVHPCVFLEGDLVLVYDQDKDTLWTGNLNHYGMALTLFLKF